MNWRTVEKIATNGLVIWGLRFLWQGFPGLWAASLFWTIALTRNYRESFRDRSRLGLTASFGATLNALVTLANGGHMPVAGLDKAHSLWIPLTADTHLAALCDVIPLGFGGHGSIGDVFIFGALLAMLAGWAIKKLRGQATGKERGVSGWA